MKKKFYARKMEKLKKRMVCLILISIISVSIYVANYDVLHANQIGKIQSNKQTVKETSQIDETKIIEEKIQQRDEKEQNKIIDQKQNTMDRQGSIAETIDSSIEKNIVIAADNTVSITDFGAVGDSLYYNEETNKYYADENYTKEEHKNAKAIQECFNFASANNCNVRIPKGTYCIETYVLIPDNVEILGEEGSTFLMYDTFSNTRDDFAFRNAAKKSDGRIKISDVNFIFESQKQGQYANQDGYIIKLYDVANIEIENCDMYIHSKGGPILATNIDIRGNSNSINIKNCHFENDSGSKMGGNVWIRNNNLDGNIENINIENSTFTKNGNDEAIAIWGKSNINTINIRNNKFTYTNKTDMQNDIFITCYGTADTWNVNQCIFDQNTIDVVGNMAGLLSMTAQNGNINNVQITKNTIRFASPCEAWGGIIKVFQNRRQTDNNTTIIKDNIIDTASASNCRQIISAANVNPIITNNTMKAKVSYGLLFLDNNCEKAKVIFNNNKIESELGSNASLVSTKNINLDLIMENNRVQNIGTNNNNLLYIANENPTYSYQKDASQSISFTDNQFKNFYRIIQYADTNHITKFEVRNNDFQDLFCISYGSKEQKVFKGEISIINNNFYHRYEDEIMNILKANLDSTDQIVTAPNNYIGEQYKIKGDVITNISAKTTIKDFIERIKFNKEDVKIYKKDEIIQDENYVICTGDILKRNNTSYKLIVRGDVNKDGNINIADVMRMKKYIVGSIELEEEAAKATDVNEDGTTNIADVMKLKKEIVSQ